MSNKIKKMAYENVTNEVEWQLKVWWGTTYNKPILHNSIDEYILEELLLEFYMNKFFTDPVFKKDYEQENGLTSSKEKEDEEWFKRQMGEDYNSPNKDEEEIHEKF